MPPRSYLAPAARRRFKAASSARSGSSQYRGTRKARGGLNYAGAGQNARGAYLFLAVLPGEGVAVAARNIASWLYLGGTPVAARACRGGRGAKLNLIAATVGTSHYLERTRLLNVAVFRCAERGRGLG